MAKPWVCRGCDEKASVIAATKLMPSSETRGQMAGLDKDGFHGNSGIPLQVNFSKTNKQTNRWVTFLSSLEKTKMGSLASSLSSLSPFSSGHQHTQQALH